MGGEKPGGHGGGETTNKKKKETVRTQGSGKIMQKMGKKTINRRCVCESTGNLGVIAERGRKKVGSGVKG